jgi:hypothetical protein
MCHVGLGLRYDQTRSGPSVNKPLSLYFTPQGQLSGVGTVAFGDFKGAAVDQGYVPISTLAKQLLVLAK